MHSLITLKAMGALLTHGQGRSTRYEIVFPEPRLVEGWPQTPLTSGQKTKPKEPSEAAAVSYASRSTNDSSSQQKLVKQINKKHV